MLKVKAKRSEFARAVSSVGEAACAKGVLPILTNILVQVFENRMALTATDLEVTARTQVEVENQGEKGAITVPLKKLKQILSGFKGADVILEGDNSGASIKCGKSKYKLPVIPSKEFPMPDKQSGADTVRMEAKTLSRMIAQTVYAVEANKHTTKPIFCGVCFRFNGENVLAVGTNGHRLSRFEAKYTSVDAGGPGEMVVPDKALAILARNLPDEGEVELRFNETTLTAVVGEVRLHTRLLEGKYPNIASVFPVAFNYSAKVKVAEVLAVLKRLRVIADPVGKRVVLKFTPHRIELQAHDLESGAEGNEEILAGLTKLENAEEDLEDSLTIGYNLNYLIEALTNSGASEVEWKFVGPTNPALVEPSPQREGETLTKLLMPIRLQ